jgi:hypothetical protein
VSALTRTKKRGVGESTGYTKTSQSTTHELCLIKEDVEASNTVDPNKGLLQPPRVVGAIDTESLFDTQHPRVGRSLKG